MRVFQLGSHVQRTRKVYWNDGNSRSLIKLACVTLTCGHLTPAEHHALT